jgi:hypothetical protein
MDKEAQQFFTVLPISFIVRPAGLVQPTSKKNNSKKSSKGFIAVEYGFKIIPVQG